MKVETIQTSLLAADNWQKKGQPVWVSRCLATALLNLLSISLERCSNADSAIAWLRHEGVENILSRHVEAIGRVVADVDRKVAPGASLGGNYDYLVFSHFSWLLSKWNEGEWYARIAIRPDVMEISTPFWREYANAVNCLVNHEPYERKKMRSRGLEKYWVSYLQLFEEGSKNGNLDEALIDLDRSFIARNGDSGVSDDLYEIEGSGRHPVQWDFRRHSIISFIDYCRTQDQR